MSGSGQILEVGDLVPTESASEHAVIAAIAEARGKHPVVLYFLRAFT